VVLENGWLRVNDISVPNSQQLVHRCGGSTLLQELSVSRLTADMNISASTKTPPFYRQMGVAASLKGLKTDAAQFINLLKTKQICLDKSKNST
jgi:hypothetical protein